MKIMLVTLLANLMITPAVAAAPLDGTWTNPARTITVRVGRCGRVECGRVISASSRARQRAAEAGTPRLVGTEIISHIEQTGPETWRAQIFVPDENVRSTGDISVLGQDTISVRGCMVGGLLCKEQSWTRVAATSRHRR